MMRRKISIKGVDCDVIAMLQELRVEERRVLGAIVGDAIRHYWETVFESDTDEQELV